MSQVTKHVVDIKIPKYSAEEARRQYLNARKTTLRTCQLLEEIAALTKEPLRFIPGHRMKPKFKAKMEAALVRVKTQLSLASQQLTGER